MLRKNISVVCARNKLCRRGVWCDHSAKDFELNGGMSRDGIYVRAVITEYDLGIIESNK